MAGCLRQLQHDDKFVVDAFQCLASIISALATAAQVRHVVENRAVDTLRVVLQKAMQANNGLLCIAVLEACQSATALIPISADLAFGIWGVDGTLRDAIKQLASSTYAEAQWAPGLADRAVMVTSGLDAAFS